MEVDKNIIIALMESAMTADYTGVRRLGNQLVKQFIDQGDADSARIIHGVLKKRGVPLQASGFSESLPRDTGSRLPLIEEGAWPSTPIMLGDKIGHVINQFVEDAQNIHLLSEKGIASRLGLLLFGPPGTGKSLLASHIAAKLKKPFYIVRLDSLISSRLGETAKNIRGVFEFIPSRDAVLFLDEMDAIAKLRDDRQELGELKRVVNAVLQGLDFLPDEVVTIASTNHPHLLDPAIWRRFPYKAELELPDEDVRFEMWTAFLFEGNATNRAEAKILARVSAGLSGADIENIALGARRRFILSDEKFNLAKILLAVSSSSAGSPVLLNGREFSTEDKKHLTNILHEIGGVGQGDISEIIGVSRQTVHRYLKEAQHG